MNSNARLLIYLFILIRVVSKFAKGDYQFLSAVAGEVSKENYTYYNITYDGTILLELTSTSGDCDLYVSQKTIKPTYDVHNHCLQSATCGVDVVVAPKSFKRPFAIGIYGYSSHEVSQYILVVSKIDESLEMQHAHLYVESLQTDNLNKKYQTHEFEVNESKEEEAEAESPFWAFLKLFFRNLLENFFNSRNPSILDFF